MKELVWVCGIIPEDVNNEIKEICLKENEDLNLSERFFRFNLHISLKRTFYTEEFDQIKDDLKELLSAYKRIDCGNTYLVRNSDMLWLRISEETEIRKIHNEIDKLLSDKYRIMIDTFDKTYVPHITIFHKGDIQNLNKMYQRLSEKLESKKIMIDRFVVGSKSSGNFFF